MTIARAFDYLKPASVAEAARALARYGDRGRLLAGGTDLISLMTEDIVRPEAVIDLKGIRGLDGVSLKDGALRIGSLATFSDIAESNVVRKKFPLIREMIGWVASNGIRHRATMAGNICSAVPCCDSGPILLVYDATVHVAGPKGKRKIPIAEWFTGPRKTSLHKGEVAVAITIPQPRRKHAGCFVKLRRYSGEDLAQASVTVMLFHGQSYRVAFGSVAPTPIRATPIEKLLEGKPITDALVASAVAMVPQIASPITDIRSSKEYRLHMLGVMLERALRAADSRFEGDGPEYGKELI
ncbi:MAG TPA: xanthine dehydrogenase family protein subunit M [Kiritimatiellia bacterium]|nr:xanthine dehydrogenase family protein subunit M [Kiritimatiellia bacterium]